MSRGLHAIPRPWTTLNLIGPRQVARRRRACRFWLALLLVQSLGLAGLLSTHAMRPPHAAASPGPTRAAGPAWTTNDADWLRQWQARRDTTVAVLALLAHQTPEGMTLTSLKQTDELLTLTGLARTQQALPKLEQTLRQQTRYRQKRHSDASAGLAATHPVQQFILVLADKAANGTAYIP